MELPTWDHLCIPGIETPAYGRLVFEKMNFALDEALPDKEPGEVLISSRLG
jgi:hypothetical protein